MIGRELQRKIPPENNFHQKETKVDREMDPASGIYSSLNRKKRKEHTGKGEMRHTNKATVFFVCLFFVVLSIEFII